MIMIFNLLKPFAEKLKYWDKNKEKEVSYQTISNTAFLSLMPEQNQNTPNYIEKKIKCKN